MPILGAVSIGSQLLKGRIPLLGSLGRLRPPSEKRAAPGAAQLVASAKAGNATAARAIVFRTGIGIAKERAVWAAAQAQLDPAVVAAVNKPAARQLLDALVDHSNPESATRTALANFYDIANLATRTSARVPPRKGAKGEEAQAEVRQPRVATKVRSSSSRTRSSRTRDELEIAEPYQGRKRTRYERATGEAWATRYNPDDRTKWRVPESAPEFEGWPARKPTRSRARSAAARRAETAAARVGGALPRAAAALGVGTSAALAAAGAAAYYITSRVLDDIAEGNTPENLVGLATALAHSQLTRKLGRQPTRTEYNALVADVKDQLRDAINEGLNPSLATKVRRFLTLFRG